MTFKEEKRFNSLKHKVAIGTSSKLEETELNQLGELWLDKLREQRKDLIIKTHWDVKELKRIRNY